MVSEDSSHEDRYRRFHSRDRKPDDRHPAKRDRDRVLYSSALRRLGHVTQVVSPTEGIVFHNRLTHSLEVAQIGRRIAERLEARRENSARSQSIEGIDPDVVETAALVHDLGHPPHGHAVEKELDHLVYIKHGVLDGYEGNAQSFRIVTKLAMRSPRIPGLNLTRAALNASLKYPWLRSADKESQQHRKWGVYRTEQAVYEWVRADQLGRPDRSCIEAQVMDWSDDVAYAVHDVDDFYRAGLIPLDRLRNTHDHEVERFCRFAAERLESDCEEIQRVLETVIGSSPIDEPYAGTLRQRQEVRAFTAGLVGKYASAVTLSEARNDYLLLDVPSELRAQVNVLKQLTWFYVIDNRTLKTQQHGQRQVIRDLFNIYLEASRSDDPDQQGILPTAERELIEESPSKQERVRLVADLISSMTEAQLTVAHRKLTGIEPGSITDLL